MKGKAEKTGGKGRLRGWEGWWAFPGPGSGRVALSWRQKQLLTRVTAHWAQAALDRGGLRRGEGRPEREERGHSGAGGKT